MKLILFIICFSFTQSGFAQHDYDSILEKLPMKNCCIVYERDIQLDSTISKSARLDAANDALLHNPNFTVEKIEQDAITHKLMTTIKYRFRSRAGLFHANYYCKSSVIIACGDTGLNIQIFNLLYSTKIGTYVSVNEIFPYTKIKHPAYIMESSKTHLNDWHNYILKSLNDLESQIRKKTDTLHTQ